MASSAATGQSSSAAGLGRQGREKKERVMTRDRERESNIIKHIVRESKIRRERKQYEQ